MNICLACMRVGIYLLLTISQPFTITVSQIKASFLAVLPTNNIWIFSVTGVDSMMMHCMKLIFCF